MSIDQHGNIHKPAGFTGAGQFAGHTHTAPAGALVEAPGRASAADLHGQVAHTILEATGSLTGSERERAAAVLAEQIVSQVRAAAVQEALAALVDPGADPGNAYAYDPWDDAVDPSNLDDVVHGAVGAGWASGAHHARKEARDAIASLLTDGDTNTGAQTGATGR